MAKLEEMIERNNLLLRYVLVMLAGLFVLQLVTMAISP